MLECAEAASCEEKVPPLYMFTARATDRCSLHSMFPRVNHRHANYFNFYGYEPMSRGYIIIFLRSSRLTHHSSPCWPPPIVVLVHLPTTFGGGG